MKSKARNGSVLLDRAKIEFALAERGLSWTSEKDVCLVSRTTWQRIREGKRVRPRTAEDVAKYLNYKVVDLVVSEATQAESRFNWPEHPEWRIVYATPGWPTTSNGLSFFRCKVQHRHVGLPAVPQYGQARFYDLSRVPDQDRDVMTQRLTRHPLVCQEFSDCPYLVVNLCTAPVAQGQFWWVIDKWYEGPLLSGLIEDNAIAIAQLNQVMMQVAQGLAVLHERGYLIRELSPEHVIVGEGGEVRLTELDLAKLLFTDRTVSNGWSTNAYRAPEVADNSASIRSDLYSWAMVYLHAAAGDCSLNRTAIDSVEALRQQSPIRSLLRQCLSPRASQRPESAQQILDVLRSSDC